MRLGIDIGGTKTAAIVLAEDGSVHAQAVTPPVRGMPRRSPWPRPSPSRRSRRPADGAAFDPWAPACPGWWTRTPEWCTKRSTSTSRPSTSPGACRIDSGDDRRSTTTSRPRPWGPCTLSDRPCGAASRTSTWGPGSRRPSSMTAWSCVGYGEPPVRSDTCPSAPMCCAPVASAAALRPWPPVGH